MTKDFKIGLMIGLILVITSSVWLATRPSLRIDQTVPFKPSFADSANHTTNQDQTEFSDQEDYVDNTITLDSDSDLKPKKLNLELDMEPEPVYNPEELKTIKFHFVRPGESLSSIAQICYGSTRDWEKIAKANKIKKPHSIKVGQKLIIPE